MTFRPNIHNATRIRPFVGTNVPDWGGGETMTIHANEVANVIQYDIFIIFEVKRHDVTHVNLNLNISCF